MANKTPSLGEVHNVNPAEEQVDYEKAALEGMARVASVIREELDKLPKLPNDDTAIMRNVCMHCLKQLEYNMEVIRTN